jgi:hypothetical protein
MCKETGMSEVGNMDMRNANRRISTWIRSQDQNCYYPGSAFNPYGWLGNYKT